MISADTRRLGLNLGSSYANVGLMALITLFVVPIYRAALGAEQWGVLALCLTAQGLLFAIDTALGPPMVRDVARGAERRAEFAVFRRYLRVYGGVALGLFLAGQIAVSVWQRYGTVQPPDSLVIAMRLMLVQFVFQFANNAAIGFWNGLQRQQFSNFRIAGFLLGKHWIALMLVMFYEPAAWVYLVPFALVGAIEFAVNLRRVTREFKHYEIHDESAEFAVSWSGLGLYGVAAAISIVSSQIDRVFLSLWLPATEYGTYFLVATLVLSAMGLQVPIQRAFLPRIAMAASSRRAVAGMWRASLLIVAAPCLLLAMFPEFALQLWLRDPALAYAGKDVLRLMFAGAALTAFYAASGTWLLSQARYGTLIAINLAGLLVQWLALVLLAPAVGAVAGGAAWLGCGIVQALAAIWIWRKRASS
jgi:O-antigen/teichoic acid export membrane protein